MIRKFFKRLFCKHDFIYKYSQFVECGCGKAIFYQCAKCGKGKVKLI